MAKVRALTSQQASQTFAARFAPLTDRLRQIATNFGVRPYACHLVHTKWRGTERGGGVEVEVSRVPILPNPVVESIEGVSFNLLAAGALPMGTVRVRGISATFTYDQLRGLMVPREHEDHVPEPYDFFYEIFEDGRGDPNPQRMKFRPMSQPVRRAGKVDWLIVLERVSEDNDRFGRSSVGPGP